MPRAANATSDGIDWLVAEAAARGMRTLLVLTDAGGSSGGGPFADGSSGSDARRYCEWVDMGSGELTISDFYGNDTVKVGGFATRQNPRRSRKQQSWQVAHQPCVPAAGCRPSLVSHRRPQPRAPAPPPPPPPQSVFLDFTAALLSRRNTVTGVEYRFDPSVLGW
jgi:hypothetical protein